MNSTNTESVKRNPNISKWNILFEKDGKPWMTVRPQEGTEVYTCYACREIFGSKNSFLDHVNRFTIVLNFKCDVCANTNELQFYNPCALLLHSRQHYSPFGGHISLDDITVSCLPYGLVGFPPHHDIPMIYNVKDDNANGLNLNSRFYSPTKTNKGNSMIAMVPSILLFYHYKLNGTPPVSLVLKQVSTNIPRCVFTKLETNTVTTNVTNPCSEKRIVPQQTIPSNAQEVAIVNDSIHAKNNEKSSSERKENRVQERNENRDQERNESKVQERNENKVKVKNENKVEVKNENKVEVKNENRVKKRYKNRVQETNKNRIEETNENIRKQYNENTNARNEKQLQKINVKKELTDNQINSSSEPTTNEVNDIFNIPSITIKVLGNIDGNICSECYTYLPYTKLMSLHFTNTNPLNDSYQCETCKYIAATPCSLKAHKRLHTRETPYVCPECGKGFDTNMLLLDHLEDVCFHLAKQVRLRCPKKNCCKVFAQLATFMTHFEVHIQTLNKCTLCDATFYAVRDHLEHSETVHSKVVTSELIYKCTICKNSALPRENYREHINWHCIDKTLRVYVYVCKYCRNFFRSGLTYANHLLRCSKKDLTIEELRRLKKSNAAIVCLHCNYVIRLVTKLSDCPRCGKYVGSNFVTPIPERREIFPATAPASVPVPAETNTTIIPRKITCILCHAELILSEASSHECEYKYPKVVLIKDDANIKKILNMKREMHDLMPKSDNNPKRKRRKTTSPMSPKYKRPGLHGDLELQLEEPVPFKGTYSCKLCDYEENNRMSFHKHIKKHRNVSTAYQCMECGECFVVKPSFHKHLQYYHKIVNVDNYVKENQCVDESAISELRKHMRVESGEISEDVEENQCRVCLKQFDDSLELSKHFRIHGMAFLRNKK